MHVHDIHNLLQKNKCDHCGLLDQASIFKLTLRQVTQCNENIHFIRNNIQVRPCLQDSVFWEISFNFRRQRSEQAWDNESSQTIITSRKESIIKALR